MTDSEIEAIMRNMTAGVEALYAQGLLSEDDCVSRIEAIDDYGVAQRAAAEAYASEDEG